MNVKQAAQQKLLPTLVAGMVGWMGHTMVNPPTADAPDLAPMVAEAEAQDAAGQECHLFSFGEVCITLAEIPFTPVGPTPDLPPDATITPSPPVTPSRTPTPAATPTAIPDATVAPSAPNLLTNASLDNGYRQVIQRKFIAGGWEYFECWPNCPAPRWNTGNPAGLMMGSPEYRGSAFNGTPGREWVHGTNAQTWFLPWWSYQAGVYQTVTVPAGASCVAGAQVRSWSTPLSSLVSKLDTPDDRANSTWNIWIDPYGGTNYRDPRVLVSRGFGYLDGIYDQYAPISYQFTVPPDSNKVTVFIGDTRLWPFGNNQSYVDAAYLRCN